MEYLALFVIYFPIAILITRLYFDIRDGSEDESSRHTKN